MGDPATTKNTNSPDYCAPQYRASEPLWQLCQDVKDGTETIRAKRETYLPRFEAEDMPDWDARVKMTFVNDHYAQTVHDLVGLVFAKPPQLDEDVPDDIKNVLENIDGEGTNWEVFAQKALDWALDWGHSVILTDFPPVHGPLTLKDAKTQQIRPYAALYRADDILSWRTVTMGGVQQLVQVVLREKFYEDDGEFAAKEVCQYRVLRQSVIYGTSGAVTGLGDVSVQTYREVTNTQGAKDIIAQGEPRFLVTPNGAPPAIPIRIVYGGEKLGTLYTRPHLLGLAYLNLEETQVGSDYASIMHKCNVPTPVFIGRAAARAGTANRSVKMGAGIDIPLGGDAKMLEPQGAAIAATRLRMEDIRAQMRRQGAYLNEPASALTATEAAMFARQRNARLTRAARSLQDALEGVLSDFALFMGLTINDGDANNGNDGGSVMVNTDFAGAFDTAFVTVALQAYQANAIPLDIFLTVMQTGKMPDEFDAEDIALRMLTQIENDKQKQIDALKAQPPAGGMIGPDGAEVEILGRGADGAVNKLRVNKRASTLNGAPQ